ncbi:hypothetical protein B5M09_010753 [Aphanomyces astaci]|uniref:Uncharacterized protein n=1 Tax=Aphanomyces astaci TaxID=112090 RepID=A0A3R7WCT9_APHAT|nr:hypothetical protein B5M09_010753 [Aphanomyces astaci]
MTFRADLVYPKMSDADEKATPRSSRGSAKGGKDDKDDMDLQMQDINSDDKGVPPKRTSGWGDTTHADTSRSSTAASEGGSGDAAESKRGRRRKEEKAEAAKPKNKHFDDDGETTGKCTSHVPVSPSHVRLIA